MKLDTTQIYAQVSIRRLKAIHTATHPGKLARVGQHALEEEPEPTVEDLLEALGQEAEEEGE